MPACRRRRPTWSTTIASVVLLALSVAAPVEASDACPGDPRAREEGEIGAASETSLQVDWYGFIKFDSSWDSSLIDPGNFARWVASPSIVEEHPHFNMTARQSRLGVDLDQTGGGGPPINAKIEIDFYGGGAENKNRPQLRYAYFDLSWPDRSLRLRAGQTSDVISPLAPTTLNYTVAWWVGNIGYRRPLVRATKALESGSGDYRFAFALSRTIGDDFGAAEPGDSGVDSGFPTVQVAASRTWAAAAGRSATMGVSAHWGQERLEEALGQPAPEFDSWSANLDLQLPMAATGKLKAEAWIGQNLDDYFGGIGQGIDFGRNTEIEAAGGWLAYETRLGPAFFASLGYGIDDPDDETVSAGARSRNQALWANLVWDFRPALRFGLEAAWWQTDYVGAENASSLRLQNSLIYSFDR